LEEGFIYGIMVMGVYITYKILDFPDLSVDGTFPLGACVAGVLLQLGSGFTGPLAAIWPWLVCLIAFAAGGLAGCFTGVLHVKLHITDLLSGIITMTALWTVNLLILGGFQGLSMITFFDAPTIFKSGLMALLPKGFAPYRVLLLAALMALAVKLLMDAFLKTKSGLLLRAAGDNTQYVTALAKNQGKMKILGLAIGNGCTALAGCVLAQQKGSVSVDMGIGMVVQALAAVIIGTSIFGRLRNMKPTTMVLLGTLLYKTCLIIAMFLLPSTFLKLTMAALFVAALLTDRMGKRRKGGAQNG
ncbi:MAG: ABC transporter permease, partial [Pseudoflavonifractor sp.]